VLEDDGDFLTGSFVRNTMIAPLKDADIDIFFVLNRSYYYENNQASLLDKVKSTLKKVYPQTTDMSRNGQAVTISFHDFKVDVVPAFHRFLSFLFPGYLIANTITKKWIITNPNEHLVLWCRANKEHNGNLIPLIKMMKAWNKTNGALLTSFHLECLILKILKWESITDFPGAVQYVLNKARRSIRYPVLFPVHDPAVSDSNVGAYLNTQEKRDAVLSRLETAYTRVKKAQELAPRGNVQEAFTNWRYIFGDHNFPAFG
jgi:Second Messenger Oligonucleotide or Dinucleotide Synthetase domain